MLKLAVSIVSAAGVFPSADTLARLWGRLTFKLFASHKVDSSTYADIMLLYFEVSSEGAWTKCEVKLFDEFLIFANAVDSLRVFKPTALKLTKLNELVESRGATSRCAGKTLESSGVFWYILHR